MQWKRFMSNAQRQAHVKTALWVMTAPFAVMICLSVFLTIDYGGGLNDSQ